MLQIIRALGGSPSSVFTPLVYVYTTPTYVAATLQMRHRLGESDAVHLDLADMSGVHVIEVNGEMGFCRSPDRSRRMRGSMNRTETDRNNT